jgi:hypothetical protein
MRHLRTDEPYCVRHPSFTVHFLSLLTTFQLHQKGQLRMPTLPQQDAHLANPHPLRRQTPLPGTPRHEHCHSHVHRPLRPQRARLVVQRPEVIRGHVREPHSAENHPHRGSPESSPLALEWLQRDYGQEFESINIASVRRFASGIFLFFFNQNTDWDYMGGFNGARASFSLLIRDWIDMTHCLGRKEKRPFCITRLIERIILE